MTSLAVPSNIIWIVSSRAWVDTLSIMKIHFSIVDTFKTVFGIVDETTPYAVGLGTRLTVPIC